MSSAGRSPLPSTPEVRLFTSSSTASIETTASFRAVPLLHRVGAIHGASSAVPPYATHTPPPPSSSSTTSSATAERAAKWAALGIDVNKLLGTTIVTPSASPSTAAAPPRSHVTATPPSPVAHHHAPSSQAPLPPPITATSDAPASSTTAHHNLVRLSRSITEARREQLFQPTVSSGAGAGKGGGGGASARFGGFWSNKKQQAKKRPRSAEEDADPAGASSGTGLREPEVLVNAATEGDLLEAINDHAAPTTAAPDAPAVPVAAQLSSHAPVAPVQSRGKKGAAAAATKPRKSAAAAAHQQGTTAASTLAASGRTLFTFSNRRLGAHDDGNGGTGGGNALVPLTAFQEVDSIDTILSEMQDDVADTTRIQAPLVGVALFTTDHHSNYSLSVAQSASTRKASCSITSAACVANREKLLGIVDKFLIHWRGQVYVVSREAGVALLTALDRTGPLSEVDVVSWHATCVYLPLLATHTSPAARLQFSPPFVLDVRVMCWMLNPAEFCTDFDAVCGQHLQQQQHYNAQQQLRSVVSQYPMSTLQGTCDRLAQCMTLYRRLYAALGSKGLLQPFLKQERQLTLICTQMKFDGFIVDVSRVDAFKLRAQETLEALHKEALSIVSPHMLSINLQSHEDCREALYGVLNLDGYLMQTTSGVAGSSSSGAASATGTTGDVATTKNGKLSTAEETLKRLAEFHRLPSIILNYRKLTKVLQTYIEGILDNAALLDDRTFFKELGVEDVDAVPIETFLLDGAGVYDSLLRQRREWQSNLRRVHATFLQEGTDTGRLSCVDPNLQNLPRSITTAGAGSRNSNSCDGGHDDPLQAVVELDGSFIRRAFVPLPGCTLVAVDFEQIELRILAHMSSDAMLIQSLSSGSDIHRQIASVVFRKTQSAISKEERTLAKRVVFGVLYGMGPRALAAQLGESYEQALHIQTAFKQGFPHVERYAARVIAQCRQDGGVVRTLCGRTRTLSDINDSNLSKRSVAERQAFNTVIQGGAADVVKKAMVAVNDGVLQNPAFGGRVRLHCQVHDELVFSVPHEHIKEAVQTIRASMTSCMLLAVPLCVSVQVGESYGALHAYSE